MALAVALAAAGAVPAGGAAAGVAATVPSHVPTWAYDDGCNGGAGASRQLVAAWVTYAESHCGTQSNAVKALRDCGSAGPPACTPVQYVDPAWIYATGSAPVPWSEPESWWLHEPGAPPGRYARSDRLRSDAYGGGYLLNPATPAVRAWLAANVRSDYDRYPALMVDDTGGSLSALLFSTRNPATGGPFTASAEIRDDATLQAAQEGLAAALRHADGTPFAQIDNGLSPNPHVPNALGMLAAAPGVRGVIAEGAPMDGGTMTPFYATLLDEIARVAGSGDGFLVLLSYDAAGSVPARLVQEATMLLGYAPGHLVDWANLETASPDLAVWPEEGIVPEGPVQSMTDPAGIGCLDGAGAVCTSGGHGDLHPPGAPPGIYVREFRDCYDRGVLFGSCAAVVNDTDAPVAIAAGWLTQPYDAQVTVTVPAGTTGDVQSGGTVAVRGAPFTPGVTEVVAHGATVLTGPAAPPAPVGVPPDPPDPAGLVAGRLPWP